MSAAVSKSGPPLSIQAYRAISRRLSSRIASFCYPGDEMTLYRALLLASCFAAGCAERQPASQDPATELVTSTDQSQPSQPGTANGPVAPADAGITPVVSSDAAPTLLEAVAADAAATGVEMKLQPSKKWPFFAWDEARSFTYNLRKPGPGAKLRVFSKRKGWPDKRVSGPVLSKAQAKRALRLLSKTHGEMIVSKCPFPRHGIVFFQGDVPVGSISVCFECGDIMIWPAYSPDPNWEDMKYKRAQKDLRAYNRVFPSWERLFETDLGLASDWEKLPTQRP